MLKYQFVHQQKQIQKFLEAYFVDGKPKVGDKIYFILNYLK